MGHVLTPQDAGIDDSRIGPGVITVCPVCDKLMKYVEAKAIGDRKDELYCPQCNLSIPLFKGRQSTTTLNQIKERSSHE